MTTSRPACLSISSFLICAFLWPHEGNRLVVEAAEIYENDEDDVGMTLGDMIANGMATLTPMDENGNEIVYDDDSPPGHDPFAGEPEDGTEGDYESENGGRNPAADPLGTGRGAGIDRGGERSQRPQGRPRRRSRGPYGNNNDFEDDEPSYGDGPGSEQRDYSGHEGRPEDEEDTGHEEGQVQQPPAPTCPHCSCRDCMAQHKMGYCKGSGCVRDEIGTCTSGAGDHIALTKEFYDQILRDYEISLGGWGVEACDGNAQDRNQEALGDSTSSSESIHHPRPASPANEEPGPAHVDPERTQVDPERTQLPPVRSRRSTDATDASADRTLEARTYVENENAEQEYEYTYSDEVEASSGDSDSPSTLSVAVGADGQQQPRRQSTSPGDRHSSSADHDGSDLGISETASASGNAESFEADGRAGRHRRSTDSDDKVAGSRRGQKSGRGTSEPALVLELRSLSFRTKALGKALFDDEFKQLESLVQQVATEVSLLEFDRA